MVVSDDEEDVVRRGAAGSAAKWARSGLKLSASSRAMAVLWLTKARSRYKHVLGCFRVIFYV